MDRRKGLLKSGWARVSLSNKACFSFLKASLQSGVQSAEESFLAIGEFLPPSAQCGPFTPDVCTNRLADAGVPLKELRLKANNTKKGSDLGKRGYVGPLLHQILLIQLDNCPDFLRISGDAILPHDVPQKRHRWSHEVAFFRNQDQVVRL